MLVHALFRSVPDRLPGPTGGYVVVGLLTLYWVDFLVLGGGGAVQFLLGVAVVLFAPGFVLVQIVGVNSDRAGMWIAAIVSASVVVVALSAIGAAAVLTATGAERTLQFQAVAAMLTGILFVLLLPLYVRGGGSWHGRDLSDSRGHWLALLGLPLLGVVAAVLVRWYGSTVGSFVFVAVLAVSVVALRYSPAHGWVRPLGIYVISLALLLHTNLTSSHIVGADIQGLYAISNHAFLTRSWEPALAGFGESIPMMTAVPSAVAMLLGTPLTLTFKLLLVGLFAFVPVLLYYVTENIVDADAAYVAALVFAFYHLSFAFTPGKQLIAELFAILVLYTLGIDGVHDKQPVLLALFSTGMVFSHYGVTYLIGFSLLAASGILFVARSTGLLRTGRIAPGYPVVLLTVATAWYSLTSPDLVARILSVPRGIMVQLPELLSGGTVERSGVTYVTTETSVLQYANILLYGVLLAFIAIGLVSLSISMLRSRSSSDSSAPVPSSNSSASVASSNSSASVASSASSVPVEYVALTIPVFLFLSASFLFVLDLWADRVFQLALVVLAPLIPVGYRSLARVVSRVTSTGGSSSRTAPLTAAPVGLTVLVVTMLLFSSGFVFAVSGDASTSTFDENANDLSFDEADLQAVEWLQTNSGISRTDSAPSTEDDPLLVDYPERVQVYTDPATYQLLRSTLSPRYYSTELVQLKNRWRPSIAPESIDEGYVFLREEAIVEDPADGPPPATVLTESEASTIRDRGTVVYDRDGVQIVEITADNE